MSLDCRAPTTALSAPVAVRDWRMQARLDRAEAQIRKIRRIAEGGLLHGAAAAALQAIVAEIRNL